MVDRYHFYHRTAKTEKDTFNIRFAQFQKQKKENLFESKLIENVRGVEK